MNQKSSTFDAYRATQKRIRTGHIRAALKLLANAHYANVTRLAADAAKIVTELEKADNEKRAPGDRRVVRNVSHVTLLRNRDYRYMLETALNEAGEARSCDSLSISDHEALKIRNANLESQNAILKERIRSFDLGHAAVALDKATTGEKEVDRDREKISFLIGFIDRMQQQVGRAFVTVLPGDASQRYPDPGFYGPNGLVATYDELLRLQAIRSEQQ